MSKTIDWNLATHIFEQFSNVIAAWVFGSAQDGKVRLGSDVDIAVIFDSYPSLDNLSELRAELQKVLRFDDIDLVVLNGASPITRFEAISGRPIFCRDVVARAEIASLTAREYEDEIAFMQSGLKSYTSGDLPADL
ncbi:MAG: nucleotidyltransferase domain-containing protein [Chloroflexota bacterium]|nr:nucleotidyltransferase domain-containing protein [Chloroflexota bacterium]